MSATRSAIHLGLNGYHSPHDGSPGPQGSCHGDDAAMALDDVKTMLFSKPDDKDMAVQEELIAQ
jgi:hypothetical protein